MKIVGVMPAYEEAARIGKTLREMRPFFDFLIVVDDGSLDATADVARAEGVMVIRHALNRGQGAALKTGTLAALEEHADVIIHVDADGQHDPGSLAILLEPIRAREADVVFGSRFLGSGLPSSRKWLLRVARLFNAYALGIPRTITDPQSGLRAMTALAARRIGFMQDRMAHCSEILRLVTHSDLRWREVPIRIRYSTETLAKGQRPLDALKIMWQILIRR